MSASRTLTTKIVVLVACLLLCGGMMCGQPVNPTIVVDNSDGTNGQASGSPGNVAAIFLAATCHTNGAASTTIQAPSHGMAATIPTDGSSALWLGTGSGRRWTKITGFPNNNTITVEDSFNIAAGTPVDCAAGGHIAGTLANVTRLCTDIKAGWGVTINNTGAGYTDSGTCTLNTSGLSTAGRVVIGGDDPDNPTPIETQSNANYIISSAGSSGLKVENLAITRNVAGSTGTGITPDGFAPVLFNNQIILQTGTWTQAYAPAGQPMAVIQNLFQGPFGTTVHAIGDDDIMVGNAILGCSGSATCLQSASDNAGAAVLFNIIDQEGATPTVLGGSTNNGIVGIRLYNTLLNGGGNGVVIGANFATIISGNLIGEASTLSGACWSSGTGAANLLGSGGEVHDSWRGNAADTCPTVAYDASLAVSPEGAATDINAGVSTDPLFQNEGALNFFPDNADMKSDLVFPGAAFPLLTTAEPVSTMTAGAAQRPGSSGVAAYAY